MAAAEQAGGAWWLPPLAVALVALLVWIPLELDARRYRRRIDQLQRHGGGLYMRRLTDDERRQARRMAAELTTRAHEEANRGPHAD